MNLPRIITKAFAVGIVDEDRVGDFRAACSEHGMATLEHDGMILLFPPSDMEHLGVADESAGA